MRRGINHSEGVGSLARIFRATRRKFALEPTMQELKPDQRWSEGLKEVTVTSVFGVRIEIRWNETRRGLRVIRSGYFWQRPDARRCRTTGGFLQLTSHREGDFNPHNPLLA
jgi:hypothetical protein